MNIPVLVKWAKQQKADLNSKKIRYEEKDMPKIEAYIGMIISRGEIIMEETKRMQRYMEDIADGIKNLEKRNVKVPNDNANQVPATK